MKRLNAKGFAHQVLILALVVVAVIGGIGSYIYLHKSSAATNYAGICGSNFVSINTWRLVDHKGVAGPGQLKVFRNSNNGKYCIFTVATGSAYGVSKRMAVSATYGASISNPAGTTVSDVGSYKYYAGPVKFYTTGSGNYGGSMIYKGVTYSKQVGW